MKRKITSICLGVFAVVAMIMGLLFAKDEEFLGATSYTNAKEFYNSTALYGDRYHAEMIDGTIYYATQAKLATSSTNLKYHTVGFDISLSGNGHTVSFTVQRTGGSMVEVDSRKDGTYQYILYAVKDDKLFDLASKADPTNAAYVLDSAIINVKMDAIITTKQGNKLNGEIAENGSGGFTKWGTIYRLKNSSDLSDAKTLFVGHEFKSYTNIYEDLKNPLLQVRYNVLGLNPMGVAPTVTSGYSMDESGILLENDSTYITKARVLQKMSLLDYEEVGLSKPGYHLPGGSEWQTGYGRNYASGGSYMPKVLDPDVGYKNRGITLYANWQPNNYKIIYHANGGTGTIADSKFTYDVEGNLSANTFTRAGYYLPEGAEWADANGNTYESGQSIKNLTTANNAEITLYANWVPCVYQIKTDKQNGSGGTDVFYEKYDTGFYSNTGCTNNIDAISIPTRVGYTLLGYYAHMNGGQMIVDASGKIEVPYTTFTQNSVIYANWKANQYMITFDKQGGEYGTDTAVATYDEVFPVADAPVWEGYSFKGYYTKPGGKGTKVYNEFMASDMIYTYAKNITLYAYWEDDVAPLLSFTTDHDTWTNQEVTLTAEAWDNGGGLKSLTIYQIKTDGSLEKVSETANLNGAKKKTITFVNTTEGIIRYKAVVVDTNGNKSESYNVVYYDITAPSGVIVDSEVGDGKFYFEIDITDINPGD